MTTPKTHQSVACENCGSSDIIFDAWSSWNEESQEFELVSTLDYSVCENCEAEESAVWTTRQADQ